MAQQQAPGINSDWHLPPPVHSNCGEYRSSRCCLSFEFTVPDEGYYQKSFASQLHNELGLLVDDIGTGAIVIDDSALGLLVKYRWALHLFPTLPNQQVATAHPIVQLMKPTELLRLNGGQPLPRLPGGRVCLTFDLARRLIDELLHRFVGPILEAEEREREEFLVARASRQSYVRLAKRGVDIEAFVRRNNCLPF